MTDHRRTSVTPRVRCPRRRRVSRRAATRCRRRGCAPGHRPLLIGHHNGGAELHVTARLWPRLLGPAQTRGGFVTPPERSGIEYATGDLCQWSHVIRTARGRQADRMDHTPAFIGCSMEMQKIDPASWSTRNPDLVARSQPFACQLGDQGPNCLCLHCLPGYRPADPAPPSQLAHDVVAPLPLEGSGLRPAATDRLPADPFASGQCGYRRLARKETSQTNPCVHQPYR